MQRLALLDQKSESMVKEYMPPLESIEALAGFFAAFSDTTRIKIITALAISPMCVSDLATVLSLNQTTLSHQLKLLRAVGVVTCARQGKISFYRLVNQSQIDSLMCRCADLLYERA